jgi:hypothetical protein
MLVEQVFEPGVEDEGLAILVDLPDPAGTDGGLHDHPDWHERREMAGHWRDDLAPLLETLGISVRLFVYPNVGTNNGDLPDRGWLVPRGVELPADADVAPASGVQESSLGWIFAQHQMILAPTELSATAPLKNAARRHGFRAATMPGFTARMVPVLRLDHEEIDRRVRALARLLSDASGARFRFRIDRDDGEDGGDGEAHDLFLDLRHRQAHASGGLIREPGTAGNLPSGESYIVPYEGEIVGDRSRSEGVLPVELDGEVVLYRIEENRAVEVTSGGPVSEREAAALAAEPAYGNIAELGLGVLADFGLQPIGKILLDEKLGLHIAFGRSDHFGGQVGADDFSSPRAVVHIDRVYLPELQPRVTVERVVLERDGDDDLVLMEDGGYVIEL